VLGLDHQGLFDRTQQCSQLGLQGLVQGIRVGQFLARDPAGQALDDHRGSLDADVGGQQTGFQFFEQVVVYDLVAQEQAGHAFAKAGTGLGQALLEASEEPGLGLCRSFRGRSRGNGRRGFDNGRHHVGRHRCDGGRLDDRSQSRSQHRCRCRCRCRCRHDGRFDDRCRDSLGSRSNDRRRCLGGIVFDQPHRLFGNRQDQTMNGRLLGNARLRLGLRCQDRFRRQRHRSFYGSLRSRFRNVRGLGRQILGRRCLWLFGDRCLRLLAQPSEQAFLFTGRGRGLFVVVGTKHGRRLSQGSDAPGGESEKIRRRNTDCFYAGSFTRNILSSCLSGFMPTRHGPQRTGSVS
jgi:hypothetical protein